MTDRDFPKPDLFASCPKDERILEYYKGQFDSVYVLLSPFIKPISIALGRFIQDTYPAKSEIIEGCEPIFWKNILEMTNLSNFSEIDIGLRTSISGLKVEFQNRDFSVQLDNLFDDLGIMAPTEGRISEFIENRIYLAIKSLGQQWLWVGDEFCSERKLYFIDDLVDKDELKKADCIFTPDKSLLVTSHWDSHCSFLCANRPTIEKILAFDDFEGFYCTDKTEVYWGLYEI